MSTTHAIFRWGAKLPGGCLAAAVGLSSLMMQNSPPVVETAMSAVVTLLQKALEWGPTILKLLAYILAMIGGGQTGGIVSGAYGGTVTNWLWNAFTYGGAIVSYLLANAFPTSLPTIEKWLTTLIAEAKKRLNIDPKNETDVDERFFSVLGEFVLKLLELLLKRWVTDPDEAANVIAQLRVRKAIAESGIPAAKMQAALSAIALPAASVAPRA